MEQKYLGEDVKIGLSVNPINDMTLADIDWEVELWCVSNKKLVIKKEDAIRYKDGEYFITFNTTDVGEGILQLKINYKIPDEDFADSIRNEFDIYKIMKIVKP